MSLNLLFNDFGLAEGILREGLEEGFVLHGKAKSKWLAYNMAMRARVFDDWTESMLENKKDAIVLHMGCGLDSRYRRIKYPYKLWLDCDLPDVTSVRRKYHSGFIGNKR